MAAFLYCIRARVVVKHISTYFDLANIVSETDEGAIGDASVIARDELGMPLSHTRFQVLTKQPITDC